MTGIKILVHNIASFVTSFSFTVLSILIKNNIFSSVFDLSNRALKRQKGLEMETENGAKTFGFELRLVFMPPPAEHP